MMAIYKDWGLYPASPDKPEVAGILKILSSGERLTLREIGQRWEAAGNEDLSGCEIAMALFRIAVDNHPLHVEEDDDFEEFYQIREIAQ